MRNATTGSVGEFTHTAILNWSSNREEMKEPAAPFGEEEEEEEGGGRTGEDGCMMGGREGV